jgi:hypothetical protein
MLFPPKVICRRLISLQFDLHYSHWTQTAFPLFIMVIRMLSTLSTLWISSSGLGLLEELGTLFSRLELLALSEQALALISEVKSEVRQSDRLTSVLKDSCLYYQKIGRGKKGSAQAANCSFDFRTIKGSAS